MRRAFIASLFGFSLSHCTAVPSTSTAIPPTDESFHVGQAHRAIHPPVERHWRGASTEVLRTTIWFPVDPALPEQPHEIGPPGQTHFVGHPLVPDASPSMHQATYPLIVMSHGTGGSANSLDWLAAGLAASGYVVAAVDHPGNNAREPLTWDGATLWWERATDLSEVIDAMLTDPVFGERIDSHRIGAIGFSLGGYTVLELAGARTDQRAFSEFCDSPQADAICHPPEMARLDEPDEAEPSAERAASIARSGASYRDSRVRAVFTLAPGLGQAFEQSSLASIELPVEILVGEADMHVPLSTNARHIASWMPGAKLTIVPKAGHYTFLAPCGPDLRKKAPMLCEDNEGVERSKVHHLALEAATGFFERTLRSL